MLKESAENSESVETVTLDTVQGVFDEVERPVVLLADVNDALDHSCETARQKLEQLYERDEADCGKGTRKVIF